MDSTSAVRPFVERRLLHYSNLQQILLVGEGDFSFSNTLAVAFGSGHNLVATSLDSHDEVLSKYAPAAPFTLTNLKQLGALLFHGVDATRMAAHNIISNLSFDCIVYNFPHAGFSGPEGDKNVIRRHKRLVKLFFTNAANLLRKNGEVHVSHKVKAPYCDWKLEKQAAKSGLVLKECCDFEQSKYPGYTNRRGDGGKCADSFYLGACKTFKFVLSPSESKVLRPLRHLFEKGLDVVHSFLPTRLLVHPRRVVPFGVSEEERHLVHSRQVMPCGASEEEKLETDQILQSVPLDKREQLKVPSRKRPRENDELSMDLGTEDRFFTMSRGFRTSPFNSFFWQHPHF